MQVSKEERNHEIRILCESGKTDAEIAKLYGISRSRVAQIRTKKTTITELSELSTRLRNNLARRGIKTKEQLIENLEKGFGCFHIGKGMQKEMEELTGQKIKAKKKSVWDEISGHPYIKYDWFLIFESE